MEKKAPRGRTLLCAALWLLALASLAIQWDVVPADGVRLLPLGLVGGLVMALWATFVFWRLRSMDRPFGKTSLWLLGLLLAGVLTLGQSFAALGTTELFTGSRLALGKALLFFAGRVALYYGSMRWLQLALRGAAATKGEERLLPGFFTRPKAWLLLAGLLLLCWLPYFICTFPGVVSNDSITQLKEIFGVVPLSNGNPVFQTFLVAVFARLGLLLGSPDAGVVLYCCGQALLMALLLGYVLQTMAKASPPRWLLWASLAFFALCPIFPLFAFCVGKDTNFAMAVLLFSLMVWQALQLSKEAKAPPVWLYLGLCGSAALALLLRNPGAYLVMLTLALLLLWSLLNRKREKARYTPQWPLPATALACSLGLWLALHLFVLPSLHALPMPETEELSLPLQQVARVVASQPERLAQEEKDIIGAVMDYDKIKPEYQGELSDAIKLLWKEDATRPQKQDFFRLWVKLAPRCPTTYFSATFHNVYGYLCPGYLSVIKPTLLIGKQGRTTEIDAFFPFSVNPASQGLSSAMDGLSGFPLSRVLLSPGLYGCITLFAFATLLCSRQKGLLLAAVPAVFSLAGCLLSAVNGYFRYAMPLYFSAPLLLALCAQALSHSKEQGETTK